LPKEAAVASDLMPQLERNGDPLHNWALRAQQGDEEAAEKLVDALSDRLFRSAVLILQDRHHAEDALQEALLAAIQQADNFGGGVPFARWVHRILVNRCYSFHRSPRHRRWLTVGNNDDELAADRDAFGTFAGRHNLNAQTRQPDFARQTALADEVRQAMLRLPVHYRTVLVLHYYEDRPITEIATTLGLREGTVKSQLHRARQRMRRLLKRGAE